jgi:hypothetical protein
VDDYLLALAIRPDREHPVGEGATFGVGVGARPICVRIIHNISPRNKASEVCASGFRGLAQG